MEGFHAIFRGVGDPRKSNATKHDLIEMLAVALLATLSGKSSCSSFARYARVKYEFLKGFLELKGGPPSHDAFSDLFDALDPKQMAVARTKFANALLAALPSDQVVIDGKVLRSAILDASKQSALHLVGRTAAADAMHCQHETSARIVEKGGDCVLPAKGNQGTLHEDIQVWFSDPEAQKEMLSCRHVGGGHGRVETRVATVSHDVGRLQDRHGWSGLKAIGRIEAVRELKGRTEQAVRYCIMSAEIPPERLLELTRNHWRIENCLHWVLDVVVTTRACLC